MAKYNMTFEEAQDYISRRGFDIPWNDCDVFINEIHITQTVANVLKWADDNPNKHTFDTDAFIEKACEWLKESITNNPECNRIISKNGAITMGLLIEDFRKYMKGE